MNSEFPDTQLDAVITTGIGERVNEFVERTVADGHLAVGAQISVRHRDEEYLLVRGRGGTGRELKATTRLRGYCAAKPLVAYVALAALDGCRSSVDTAIGEILNDELDGFPAHVAEYTLRNLLRHETTMLRPVGTETVTWPSDQLLPECAHRAHETARGQGYSEVTSWLLLTMAVERLTGQTGPELIDEHLLTPAGMAHTSFGLPRAEAVRIADEVEANVSLRGPDAVPMLSDRSPRNLRRFEPAFGAYTTASDLSRFYEYLLHPRDSSTAAVVDAMTCDRRPRMHDPGLAIECAFGRGVMVGLADFSIANRASAAAYGHSGFIGTVFGLADPAVDLAIGCVFVGITDAQSTAAYLRPTLVDMIYDELLRV